MKWNLRNKLREAYDKIVKNIFCKRRYFTFFYNTNYVENVKYSNKLKRGVCNSRIVSNIIGSIIVINFISNASNLETGPLSNF